jgi:serine/threonine protein kinase
MTNSSSFATLFNTFSIAIIFLESQRKVHRNISYTNILLREPRNNLPKMEENWKRVMSNLGLAEIKIQHRKFRCQEKLLIDFDYGSDLAVVQSQEME